jgi:hypothetical protein
LCNALSFVLQLTKNIKVKIGTIYRTIIVLIDMYGHIDRGARLIVIENRVMRRIFGGTKDGVTRKWRRLRNEELYDLYPSLNIIQIIKLKIIRWEGLVACMGYRRGAHRVLVGKPGGRRPLGRWRSRIKMDIQEVGWGN